MDVLILNLATSVFKGFGAALLLWCAYRVGLRYKVYPAIPMMYLRPALIVLAMGATWSLLPVYLTADPAQARQQQDTITFNRHEAAEEIQEAPQRAASTTEREWQTHQDRLREQRALSREHLNDIKETQ